MKSDHEAEVDAGARFEFGRNWQRFLHEVDERRIALAVKSLEELLDGASLEGRRFLDAGSGSGLFSLAARRLGANVTSFDFDPASVACTREMQRRFAPDDPDWTIVSGSVLDEQFLATLGRFDIVYSWGVLHHTGGMWPALGHVGNLIDDHGLLAVALYNDQGRGSRTWLRIKRWYNRLPGMLRWIVLLPCFIRLWGPTMVRDCVRGKPFNSWRHYADDSIRGMSPWYDLIDWVGGLPFEVAKPEELLDFYRARDFELVYLKTCAGGIGCNEFVFRKPG